MLRTAPAAVLLALSIYLYGTQLGTHVRQPEELQLAAASMTLSTNSWHDGSGRLLPLFVEVSQGTWLMPIPAYAHALLTKVWLPSAPDVRWTAALMGALDVLLLYYFSLQVFRSRAAAFVAGLMLLLSPAHVTYSRLASANGIWQLPFITVWLIGLVFFVEGSFLARRWMLSIGVAALGASIYTQPSAGVTLPWFGLATVVAIRRAPDWKWTDVALACGVFACALAPLVPWFAAHPSTYPDTFGRWLIHQAHLRRPVDWAVAWSNFGTLAVCSSVFWDFFSPSNLFLGHGAAAGDPVFSVVTGLLIVCGVAEVVRTRKESEPLAIRLVHHLALVGFIIGPLAASTFKEPRPIERALVILPFGVLLATVGLTALWTRGRSLGRLVRVHRLQDWRISRPARIG